MGSKGTRKQLEGLYGNRCFLLGELSRRNILTYHHIERNNKRNTTVDNGALLARFEHTLLHLLEKERKKSVREINDGFQEFKRSRKLDDLYQLRGFLFAELDRLGYEINEMGRHYTR